MLKFNDLSFEKQEDALKVYLLKQFYFHIPSDELPEYSAEGHEIAFKDKSFERKFGNLISKHIPGLKSRLHDRQAFYIHKNSGIPLIGSNVFGLVDRNTNCIEVKPITGCNLNCIYCSIDEGADSKKAVDFVIEKDYIVEELIKLIAEKGCDDIEIHLNGHGEPLLYADIADLVKDITAIPEVVKISIDTNAFLLSESLVDELVEAGLTQFNLSINAFDPELAKKIAGTPIDAGFQLKIAKYISKKADLVIAPVMLQGLNDEEMPKLMGFIKELQQSTGKKITLGIQNFLEYNGGRNPVDELSWADFQEKLKGWEKQYNIHLLLDLGKDFNIKKTGFLDKPFKKSNTVTAKIVAPGRFANEMLAAAEGRLITVPKCDGNIGDKVKLRITRDKHNVFYAEQI